VARVAHQAVDDDEVQQVPHKGQQTPENPKLQASPSLVELVSVAWHASAGKREYKKEISVIYFVHSKLN
jgi:hypothetical protein